MACGSGTSYRWIDASDSPSFRRSLETAAPSDVSTSSLLVDLDLLARHHVAALRVDRLETDDVVAAQAGDRARDERLQLFALRNLARERPGDALVGRALHEQQVLARALVRKHLQERRLFQRDGQGDLQRAVEHRIAGGVDEVGQDDRVASRQGGVWRAGPDEELRLPRPARRRPLRLPATPVSVDGRASRIRRLSLAFAASMSGSAAAISRAVAGLSRGSRVIAFRMARSSCGLMPGASRRWPRRRSLRSRRCDAAAR